MLRTMMAVYLVRVSMTVMTTLTTPPASSTTQGGRQTRWCLGNGLGQVTLRPTANRPGDVMIFLRPPRGRWQWKGAGAVELTVRPRQRPAARELGMSSRRMDIGRGTAPPRGCISLT